ncbi:MAG: aldehyde ferredoxin oxidoreductase C-terminal domain-containing protein [Burkholderiaceae bacterium]
MASRKYLHINLNSREVRSEQLEGRALAEAGRYFIAKTLLADGVATVEPLSADNPLIFSAGPFAGTNFSNANRLSVGCKSPLTGGIKESNAGGTFAIAMGQLEIAGFTLNGQSDEWVIIRMTKDGEILFEDATPFMGKGNFDTAKLLHEKYGKKVSLAICGPVGEYEGLLSGIAISDADDRPVRIAARGGVGAVMGNKKVKAIVADKLKMPQFHDRRKVMDSIKEYGNALNAEQAIANFGKYGTAQVADLTNTIGGLPVRNFSAGRLVDPTQETLLVGGDHIQKLNSGRGGDTTHACMQGCLIKCSNVYVDEDGKEMVSPLEYETIGLMGTNCGLNHPDQIARVNNIANDLGVDTIELGGVVGIMMDHGLGEFGDEQFMMDLMSDIMKGNERGRILAQGAARVGEHYGIKRVPVIKKQTISAYDPRVVEVTGVSMMLTAQGADHTVGNLPGFDCKGKTIEELARQSYNVQLNSAIADSTGLCLFGRSVNDTHRQLLADAINSAFDAGITPDFFLEIARDTLRFEAQFNEQAGFTEADDELPQFMLDEGLAPTNNKGRLHSAEVNKVMREIISQASA